MTEGRPATSLPGRDRYPQPLLPDPGHRRTDGAGPVAQFAATTAVESLPTQPVLCTPAPWLTIVGCLPSGALAPNAPEDVLAVDAVFGPARLLDATGVVAERQRPWPKPLGDGIAALLSRRGTRTTVLASGDPLHHGIAATLLRHLPAAEMLVFPAPSAYSLAAAVLRWPLDHVALVSLHTAPAEDILRHVAPGRRILALTRDGDAPRAIAGTLTSAGWGLSTVAVLEQLGGPRAAMHEATAATLSGTFDPLNVLAVTCADGRAPHDRAELGRDPSLRMPTSAAPPIRRLGPVRAENLFHDGCVTRDEIRAIVIAALDPPGHLWDVGAGSGAVAIDWCRAGGTATLFERDPARADHIRANLAATATHAALIVGEALENLGGAPTPDRIFMGGAVADDTLFHELWNRLPSGGVFISNAVTLESEAATLSRYSASGGSLTRIALSHASPVGRLTALRPAMPVLFWRAVKP